MPSNYRRNTSTPIRFYLLCLTVSLCVTTGCVRRKLTVRTNPPGAMVYVDRQPLGASPASTQFTYWGSRHIEVVGDGYRTEKVIRTFYPPWYQIPPFDFVAETLWPWEIKAYREVDITMVPEPNVANEELIARADDLRTQAAAGVAVPINRTQGPADVIRTPVLPPGNSPPPYVPPAAIGSDALGATGPATPPVYPPVNQPWRPGQFLRNIFTPGERIPEVGGLQGGGYRVPAP